ncbi:hypothetical protein T07_3514 [Trichinella nelsoni]|uniref:Uncharacterized protein n=1 Tax=Trichinella nelsoni TaxID=6336 RepID=A0A0V0RX43_9BILA|nr:hypothetical protein T07_3514 [Trichinella nelsoni]
MVEISQTEAYPPLNSEYLEFYAKRFVNHSSSTSCNIRQLYAPVRRLNQQQRYCGQFKENQTALMNVKLQYTTDL